MELMLRLPFHASESLPALVQVLEQELVPQCEAQSFSVSVTKLEEVRAEQRWWAGLSNMIFCLEYKM